MQLTDEMMAFSEAWNRSEKQDRRTLVDVTRLTEVFLGATSRQITEVFGPSDKHESHGGQSEMWHYKIGELPDESSTPNQITFVMENKKVTAVMGNMMSMEGFSSLESIMNPLEEMQEHLDPVKLKDSSDKTH